MLCKYFKNTEQETKIYLGVYALSDVYVNCM